MLALGGVLRPAAAWSSFGSMAFEVARRLVAMSLRFIPNAICVARMLLVAPLVLWIVEAVFAAALVVLVVAGVSDGLDGFLAKRFDWQTRSGAARSGGRQAAARRAFASLTYVGLVPLELTFVVVARDVVIVLGAALLSVAHRARA